MYFKLTLVAAFFLAAWSLPTMAASTTDDYQISNRMELVGPVDLKAMNTEYQQATLESSGPVSSIVRITYFPNHHPAPLVPRTKWYAENQADPQNAIYLKPSLTANWDAPFREQLLLDLKQDGINPEALTDVEVARRVSAWLVTKFMGPAPFISLFTAYRNGTPYVIPEARPAFDQQLQQFHLTTDQQAFERGLFGKGIYRHHSAASCTPSAILWTTVFRALGIPTRIISNIPAVDANDLAQIKNVEAAIHDPELQRTLFLGFATLHQGAFANHTFTEVFVGGRWARLNYNVLDQPIVDSAYLGLQTQVEQLTDWSESKLSPAWGIRFALGAQSSHQPTLSSINPYRSLGLSDNQQGPLLPPVQITATPAKAWLKNSTELPAWIRASFAADQPGVTQIAIAIEEPILNWSFLPLKVFSLFASPQLVLKLAGGKQVLGSSFAARYYWRPTDEHGYIVNFPVDPREIPPGTLLEITAPANNNSAMPWQFRAPLKVAW